jgi:hypothetical protein
MMFFRKKPADPDIQGMSLQELKIEGSHVSDQILKLTDLKLVGLVLPGSFIFSGG